MDLWTQLVDCICRPPRDEYTTGMLMGGSAGVFKLQGRKYMRQDLDLTNKAGQKLKCSHVVPKQRPEALRSGMPCVIYCHCNSGSRRDAEEALHLLLPYHMTVFCLDFAGSGQSDGDYVTLGAREQDDLDAAMSWLRQRSDVTTIGLWGRSMGAVTALLYAHRKMAEPSCLSCLVIDSPFARLTDLMLELVEEQKIPIPRYLMRVALSMMRRSVRKRAHFNIDEVAPLEKVADLQLPLLFGHGAGDTFVRKHHSERLFKAAGTPEPDKRLLLFSGDHNSARPKEYYAQVLVFFHDALRCQGVLIPDELQPGRYTHHFFAAEAASHTVPGRGDHQPLSPGSPQVTRNDQLWQQQPSFTGSEAEVTQALLVGRPGSDSGSDVSETGSRVPLQARAQSRLRERGKAAAQQQPAAATACSHRASSRMHEADALMDGLADQDELDLARALEASMSHVREQEQRPQGGAEPAAAAAREAAAGFLPSPADYIPRDMQQMSAEDLDEAALAAAIQASLRDAEAATHSTSSSPSGWGSQQAGASAQPPAPDVQDDQLPASQLRAAAGAAAERRRTAAVEHLCKATPQQQLGGTDGLPVSVGAAVEQPGQGPQHVIAADEATNGADTAEHHQAALTPSAAPAGTATPVKQPAACYAGLPAHAAAKLGQGTTAAGSKVSQPPASSTTAEQGANR